MFPLETVGAPIELPGWLAYGLAALVFLLLAIRPFAGVCALLAFYPLMHQVPRTPVPGLNAETILVSFAVILTLGQSRLRLPPLRLTGVVLALIGVQVMGWLIGNTWISVPVESYTVWGRFRALKSHVFTSLLFFICFWWGRDEQQRRALLESVSVGIGLAALSVCINFVQGGAGRASGFYENPNLPAELFAVFSPVSLYLALRAPGLGRTRRGIHATAYGLAAAGVVLTLSRAGWLAFAMGHVVYLSLLHRRVLLAGAVGLLLLGPAAYPFLPQVVRDRIEGTFQTGSVYYRTGVNLQLESSAASRITQHRAGFLMFLDSPIWGHGTGAFYLLSVEYGARYGILRPVAPHGALLRAATELGLIGLLSYGWVALTVFGLGWTMFARGPVSGRPYGSLLLAIGAASVVSNLFGTGFLGSWLYSSAFWATFGSLAAREAFIREHQPERSTEPAWSRRARLSRAASLPG
jgi:O-antigen ligase